MFKDFFPDKKKPLRSFSDIIPVQKKEIKKEPEKPAVKEAVEEEQKEEKKQEKIAVQEESPIIIHRSYQAREALSETIRKDGISRWPFIWITLVIIFGGSFYLGWKILPRLEIKVSLKKYPVVFSETVSAAKDFSQINASSSLIRLPAELFSENRNLQLSFPATGREKINDKASGKITIYNSYSSDPQGLVANTRFSTPDNKIFRLTKAVTIPGAKIKDGKIIPSSIEAAVIADQAGAEYNIGPVDKFTLPGFKDSPKYQGFYAKSAQPMTGGFVGEIAVPTEKDTSDAVAKVSQLLENNLKAVMFLQIPKDFKTIAGSSKFEILNKTIEKKVDQDNKFSVFAEARMKLLVFREKDLIGVLTNKSLAQLDGKDYEVVDSSFEYGAPRPDFDKGSMTFPVKGQISFEKKIDFDGFRQQVVGKNDVSLKVLVFSLPGLEKAQISFWPIYVKWAPDKIEKIKITLQQ